MDRDEQEPVLLACGCPEQLVRGEGHRAGCRFEGLDAKAYPCIVEWCAYVGTSIGVVKDLVDHARRDEAPLDALWFWLRKGEERWLTVADMSTLTRARIGLPPLRESEGS